MTHKTHPDANRNKNEEPNLHTTSVRSAITLFLRANQTSLVLERSMLKPRGLTLLKSYSNMDNNITFIEETPKAFGSGAVNDFVGITFSVIGALTIIQK